MRLSLKERRTRSLVQGRVQEIRGHLARFSRDVGYRGPSSKIFQSEKWSVQSSGIPHLAKNERDVGHPAFTEQ
jgi:hypothetical protein